MAVPLVGRRIFWLSSCFCDRELGPHSQYFQSMSSLVPRLNANSIRWPNFRLPSGECGMTKGSEWLHCQLARIGAPSNAEPSGEYPPSRDVGGPQDITTSS